MATNRRKAKASSERNHSATVENCQRKVRFALAPLEEFLEQINREIGLGAGSVNVRFVTDAEMTRLNLAFRKMDKTTDVLSFPSETRSRPKSLARRVRELEKEFLGDIAISPVVAGRNASRFGRTMTGEICILMLHGVLHLLGYDHETDQGEMDRMERKLRKRFGLT